MVCIVMYVYISCIILDCMRQKRRAGKRYLDGKSVVKMAHPRNGSTCIRTTYVGTYYVHRRTYICIYVYTTYVRRYVDVRIRMIELMMLLSVVKFGGKNKYKSEYCRREETCV